MTTRRHRHPRRAGICRSKWKGAPSRPCSSAMERGRASSPFPNNGARRPKGRRSAMAAARARSRWSRPLSRRSTPRCLASPPASASRGWRAPISSSARGRGISLRSTRGPARRWTSSTLPRSRLCCAGELPDLPLLGPGASVEIRAAGVFYAPTPIEVRDALPRWAADRPAPGTRIAAGEPVCTVQATGRDLADARAVLARRMDHLSRVLNIPSRAAAE